MPADIVIAPLTPTAGTPIGKVIVSDGTGWVAEDLEEAAYTLAGGTARTLGEKLSDWVSVKDFGAVGDGTTVDTDAFSDAAAYMETNGGGTILVPVGTYRAQIALPPNTVLKGQGWNSIVVAPIGATGALVTLSAPTNRFCGVESIQLNGHTAVATVHGIHFDQTGMTTTSRHTIRDVWIDGPAGHGVWIEHDGQGDVGSGDCFLSNIQVFFAGEHGIFVESSDNTIQGCNVGQSGKSGYVIGVPGGNNRVFACKAWFSGRLETAEGYGFHVLGQRAMLSGCEAQDNAHHGFFLKDVNDVVLSGCRADSNGTGNTSYGFALDGALRCYVSGSVHDRHETATQAHPILFANSANRNLIQVTVGAHATSRLYQGTLAGNTVQALIADAEGNQAHFGSTTAMTIGTLVASGQVQALRYRAPGTAHDAGDYALHANWGSGAAITVGSSRDQAGRVTVTSGASGTGTNPTVILTFADGAWTVAPSVVVSRGDENAVAAGDGEWRVTAVTTTAVTVRFLGTPATETEYVLDFLVMGR